MVETFRTGGPFVYVILMLAILGMPLMVFNVILTMFSKNKNLLLVMGTLSLMFVLLVCLSTYVGYSSGINALNESLSKAPPEIRQKLTINGTRIATQMFEFGRNVALGMLPGILAFLKGLFIAKSVQHEIN